MVTTKAARETGRPAHWAGLLGMTWDDYSHLDGEVFLARMREQLASVPAWSGRVSLTGLSTGWRAA